MTKEGIVLTAVGGVVALSMLATVVWTLGPVRLFKWYFSEWSECSGFWSDFFKLWWYSFAKDPTKGKRRDVCGGITQPEALPDLPSGVTQVEGIPDLRGWPEVPSHHPTIRLRENDFIDLSTPVPDGAYDLFREREAVEAEGYRFQYPERSKGPEMVRKDLKASGQEPKNEVKKNGPMMTAALYGIIAGEVYALIHLLFFS